MQEKIDRLGLVRHLISPNKIHYAHIDAWTKAYPEAIAWASPGVRDRAKQQNIEVNFYANLEEKPPLHWANEIDRLIFTVVDLWMKLCSFIAKVLHSFLPI